MALQQEVRQTQAVASAGQVSRNLLLSSFRGALTADANVCVGCFVKQTATTKDNEVVGASGVAVTTATDRIVGVCVKSKLINATTMPVETYPKSYEVEYMEKGYIWIETESTANTGQYVFLNEGTGALEFDDATTKVGSVFTGWRVTQGATVTSDPQMIEISNA